MNAKMFSKACPSWNQRLDLVKRYFTVRGVLIDTDLEPSSKRMAKSFGMSRTTFIRKIESRYILKIGGSVFSKIEGQALPYPFDKRVKPIAQLQALHELPFVGLVSPGSAPYNHHFKLNDRHNILALGLYNALVKNKFFNANLGYGKGIAYTVRVLNLFIGMALSNYRIHSKNKDLRYLQRYDKRYSFNALFERKGNYRVGIKSSKTYFTKYTEDVILPDVIKYFFDFNFDVKADLCDTDLVITKEEFMRIERKRDQFIFLGQFKGYDTNGDLVIDCSLKDDDRGRTYSIFTAIGSETRKQLGIIGYDMDSALQSIVLNHVDKSRYPEHVALNADKKAYRNNIALECDSNYKVVKKALSASDNGQVKNTFINKSESFARYQKESEAMVLEYLKWFSEHNKEAFRFAHDRAKPIFDKKWNKRTKKYDFTDSGKKNPFSVFFFCWTMEERDIREAMKTCFSSQTFDCHDAIYSRGIASVDTLENAVREHTGLTVGIECDTVIPGTIRSKVVFESLVSFNSSTTINSSRSFMMAA